MMEIREHPLVTVDVVILTIQLTTLNEGEECLQVLLVQRKQHPFWEHWAIPGGFVLHNERLDDAAQRELREKAGVSKVYLEQLYTFGEPARDPRARVITISYYALVRSSDLTIHADEAGLTVAWFPVTALPERMAFDHRTIVETAVERVRSKVDYAPIAFQFVPDLFTMAELRHVYEIILERKLDPGNFIHKVLASGLVEATAFHRSGNRHRPPRLYRFIGLREEAGLHSTHNVKGRRV
ncbi:MAG: NUDIX hydrolase [Chloroflexi bacterium]|nr:NUDIX hydrolase [Chloroflexota bacterium]